MTKPPKRSAAAAAASRRNGARSNGPRTASGKVASSRNALKHGMFSTAGGQEQEASPARTAVATMLSPLQRKGGESHYYAARANEASANLDQATLIIQRINEQIAGLLTANAVYSDDFDQLLVQLHRMVRYQRRFRGQRDRALRKLMIVP